MTQWYLVSKHVKGYGLAEDRERFSHPVPVEMLYCHIATRLVYCRCDRGNVFPVTRDSLHPEYRIGQRRLERAERYRQEYESARQNLETEQPD